MIWIIIEMSFPALLIILPMSLYRSNRLFMAKFYLRMAGSESARKLYVQCMLIFLLLYHYVYAGRHFGEWGVLISTIPCAVLFSFRRADRWMHRLHEDKKKVRYGSLHHIGHLRCTTSAHHGVHTRLSSFGCHVLSLLPCVSRMAG